MTVTSAHGAVEHAISNTGWQGADASGRVGADGERKIRLLVFTSL